MENEQIEIGKVVNTHGTKGELKVLPWADSPEFIAELDYIIVQGDGTHAIRGAKVIKNCAILSIDGCDNMNDAEKLKGRTVYIYKKDLPPLPDGRFYIRDMIGLKVMSVEGAEIGILDDVLQTGANDVYEVKKPDGSFAYLPAVRDCVKQIDLKSGEIIVELPAGLDD